MYSQKRSALEIVKCLTLLLVLLDSRECQTPRTRWLGLRPRAQGGPDGIAARTTPQRPAEGRGDCDAAFAPAAERLAKRPLDGRRVEAADDDEGRVVRIKKSLAHEHEVCALDAREPTEGFEVAALRTPYQFVLAGQLRNPQDKLRRKRHRRANLDGERAEEFSALMRIQVWMVGLGRAARESIAGLS